MKKTKFSSAEKKVIRFLVIFAFVQLIIFLLFVHTINESKVIDPKSTKQRNIIAEEIYYVRTISEYRLVICAESEKYYFSSRSTPKEYSCSEMNESVSVGDSLSLTYYEKNGVFGNKNWVVAAHSGTETFRSLEEYNKGKVGIGTAVNIMFGVLEAVSLSTLLGYLWIRLNVLKQIGNKLKHKKKTKKTGDGLREP